MASLDEFESTLKEVVRAKRVSASKMTTLTELALKSMDNDTQLVSILYRTHKALPSGAKVSSLYAFDALARAARSKVIKHNLTGDINSEKGNCATFLLKVEGVLDGLFQDMAALGSPESKEKSKKILDIWTKSNTFPSTVLTRLRDMVKEAEKESNKVVTTAITDPRTVNQSPTTGTITTPIATPPSTAQPSTSTAVDPVQSTLLALLSQAANAGAAPISQILPNTGAAQPQLDPAQLALLQQLAQKAKLGNGISSQPVPLAIQSPVLSTRPDSTGGFKGPIHPHPPYRDDRYDSGRGDPRYGRYDNPGRGRSRGDFYDDRQGYRGSYRGGGSWGGRGRGVHNDRENFRDRDGYRSPPPRSRRSRSRSPPVRYGARKEVKPYSPPQRPTLAPSPKPIPGEGPLSIADSIPISTSAVGVEKDEFGRDIRPQSPRIASAEKPTQPPSLPGSIVEPAPAIGSNQLPSVPQPNLSAVTSNTSSQIHSAPAALTSQPGLDKFNMSTFDFTAPSSWEALGKMWQVTYGYLPSQEDLMQFVMSGGIIASAAAAGMIPGQYQDSMMGIEQVWPQSGTGFGGRQGGGVGFLNQGGGSGYGHVDTRNGQQQWGGHAGAGYEQKSDAIVLGGGEDASNGNNTVSVQSPPQPAPTSSPFGEAGGLGGRMQRVGDKWEFVRDEVNS